MNPPDKVNLKNTESDHGSPPKPHKTKDHFIIDSHCHLDLILKQNRENQEKKEAGLTEAQIFSLMEENQVKGFIQISTDPDSIDFAQNRSRSSNTLPFFYAYTIGHHPNEAAKTDPKIGLQIAKKAKKVSEDKNFVAVGEIGLDYYYTKEHKNKQIKVFTDYLDMASELDMPVCVHTRDAHDDTVSILKGFSNGKNTLIHCFTGNESQMYDFLDIGCHISFSGIVTFKNALDIQEAALKCPPEKLLVETDAPFLSPVPFRGKVNQPAYVRHTLNHIAELKNMSHYELGKITYENTKRFYRLEL